ncbi:formate dehydrogenase accessory sulfurtransferase FdhD [Cyclobacterium jeungdonense]|uniref:Sulfur carrier protein FdhD n=1 Tax=Cyclobacterium jeungdonense TaxID=708087 RepID=A0ABT8C3D9_9BACT|nr:formate dehydrogenase accessory sulfurtransferase FdhD [Cyclobacterium jeungdonense]MDN3686283.1 formate dehydrogenase accessory sulfurtransferase FdhD [Cyclobacterium jeungdonense]
MSGKRGLVIPWTIRKQNQAGKESLSDLVAVEEPLQIQLEYEKYGEWHRKDLLVTMRSPGQDFDLAMGFLYAEGIILQERDILWMRYCQQVKPEEEGNVMRVRLIPNLDFDPEKLNRNFFTHSSCGVCGKTAIDTVRCDAAGLPFNSDRKISVVTVQSLTQKLNSQQTGFNYTGGLHAAVLYEDSGDMLLLREDVGRHNALDKLIGAGLRQGINLWENKVVLLSGRVSFEMVQKAVNAGIQVLVALGAPTSLAVRLANEKNQTLIGFLKKDRFNIYSGEERIK